MLDGPERGSISLVLLDLVMPGVDGMAVLEHLKDKPAMPPIIVQTAHGSVEAAVSAMRLGAVDFVIKPATPERLEVSIKSAIKIEALAGEISRIKKKVDGTLTFDDLIIRADAMGRVIALGKRAAVSQIPVLIEGESGVGKELIARAIQGESDRAGKPFITVNCGAIPENLIESTLFGHERGSFTGAVDRRVGKFQEADGGTLFLDEVGELPLDAQVKLLRALQEGEIDPVGSKRPVKVDFRLISATNRDMIQLVKDGKFREDLYYRLNVFPIWIPPLRERIDEIPRAHPAFPGALRRRGEEAGQRDYRRRAPPAQGLRMARQRAPARERGLPRGRARRRARAHRRRVSRRSRPRSTASRRRSPPPRSFFKSRPPTPGRPSSARRTRSRERSRCGPASGHSSLGIPAVTEAGEIRPLEDIEADMIRLALGRYRGHMTEVAKRLKIGRSTLYRKMQEYGLEPRVN